MTKRISGMSFDTYLDGDLIHIEKFRWISRTTAPPRRPVECRMAMLMVTWPQRVKLRSVRKCWPY